MGGVKSRAQFLRYFGGWKDTPGKIIFMDVPDVLECRFPKLLGLLHQLSLNPSFPSNDSEAQPGLEPMQSLYLTGKKDSSHLVTRLFKRSYS